MNRTIHRIFGIPENIPESTTLMEALRLHEVDEVFERTIQKWSDDGRRDQSNRFGYEKSHVECSGCPQFLRQTRKCPAYLS
jgi:hypothetical protein